MNIVKNEIPAFAGILKKAALEAGNAILEIYNSDSFDETAKDDNSPLTKADTAAHKIIVRHLKETGLPILSEEGRDIPYGERKNWEYFWMVDPLDGTKEFIKKNGEFTVNIALIHNGKPILGVVYAPVLDKMYSGGEGMGAFLSVNESEEELKPGKNGSEVVRVVASRSHLNEDTANYIAQFDQAETVSMGSSLKFMLIAENKADVYPRFAPTMEWDTAAAHAVLKGLDIEVMNNEDGKPLRYNKENLLNPYFLVDNF
jgi:3'(2'), 5'-bisphosphate nucleotidase